MLRILQVNTEDLASGAAAVAWNLHCAYRRGGHTSWLGVRHKRTDDPHVLTISDETPRGVWPRTLRSLGGVLVPLDEKVRGLRWVGRKFIELAGPEHVLDWWRGAEDFNFPETWRLLDLAPTRPDILHCHNLHGRYFDLRALPSLSMQVPVVLTLHDAWLLSGHCAHSFDCERWKTGCGRCPDLSIYPSVRRDGTASNWERKREILARSALHVATPSQWLMRKVEQSILAPGIVDARVIPNGVDLSIFHPASQESARSLLGIPPDAPVILFNAKSMQRNVWKDYDTVRSVTALVASRLPSVRVLVMAYEKDVSFEPNKRASVQFLPPERDPRRVAQYYQAADIYVHATPADNFPLGVLEAMACGIPVVASKVGGIPEQIEDGSTGFLVPPGDAMAMAEAIERLLADDQLRRGFSTRASTVASDRFDIDRQVDAYLDWYHRILEDWGNSNHVSRGINGGLATPRAGGTLARDRGPANSFRTHSIVVSS